MVRAHPIFEVVAELVDAPGIQLLKRMNEWTDRLPWSREDFTWKRIAIAIAFTVAAYAVFWCVRDVWFGEWRNNQARVTGRQFVPDRSHWEPYMYECGTSKSPRTCFGTRYVNIPAEYHVFVSDVNGGGNYDDPWAFSNLVEGEFCTIRSRYGASGFRWHSYIVHERFNRRIQ